MIALKRIFSFSKLIWLAGRCRAFSFLLTILQVLLIYFSNFSSDSKVIPNNVSLRIDAIV